MLLLGTCLRCLPMHAPTLLLTGFDPFGGERTNPSWLIAQALQDRAAVAEAT